MEYIIGVNYLISHERRHYGMVWLSEKPVFKLTLEPYHNAPLLNLKLIEDNNFPFLLLLVIIFESLSIIKWEFQHYGLCG